MSDWLPHLARPAWLLLLPLCAWLLWRLWHRKRRLGRWQALLPIQFQPWLLKGGRGRQGRLAWLLLGLAWLLAVLALIGPGWQRLEQPAHKRSDPLVVIVELTPLMLAGDLAPSRLEQARRKILDLLAARGEAQTAIVVYAGSAHVLVPLSDDLLTAHNLLAALSPALMPEPGQRADLAVQRALRLLDQGANGRGRLLLLTGALSRDEQEGIRRALDGRANPLLLLGVGSAAGAPVPLEDGGLLRDASGAIILPRLHGEQLAAFASSLAGGYSPLRLDEADLATLGLLGNAASRSSEAASLQPLAGWADQGHWLLLPLLLLAACAGRRGWLFVCAGLLIVPPPAQAFSLSDLWWRADQQGLRLLQRGHPTEAAQRFVDPRWRGLAHYQAGDYPAAAAAFAEADDAPSHYNRGNALARAGELEGALDAYEQALLRQPELAAAQHNRQLVEQLLHARQQARAAAEAEAAARRDSPAEADGATTAPAGPAEAQGSTAAPPASAAERAPTASTSPAQPSPGDSPDSPARSDEPATASTAPPTAHSEQHQSLEQWLRQIPDDPAELLRRKFWYEQQQRQESP